MDAPIKKGQKIGRARILYAGNEIAQVDLVAGETIERNFLMPCQNHKNCADLSVFIILAAILAAAMV